MQAPRPFGPGAGSGAAAPAAPSSPAPVQNAPAAPVAPTFAAPTLGSVSPRPGSALPALFRGIEKRPTATAAPVPAPYVPAPAAEYAPEEEALEADHDQNQDHDQEKAQAETPAQHFPQSHLQTQQPAPQPLPQSQSFAPTRPASVPPAAASIVPAARPAVPQQQPAAGSMYRAVSQPAPAPAPLRPAPLPQSPEVMARRERERDSRNMPGSVPSVRLPGVGLPPDNQAQRTTAQRAPFDPFEIVPEFEQPPKPAFVAAQSAVSAPPASSPAQYSATPARPNQPVAGTPPPGGGGNMGNRMLATAHSGDSSEALNFGDYTLPPMEMLVTTDPSKIAVVNEAELQNNARLIVETLKQFGIQTTAGDITRGATITRYELYPAVGVRVDKILSLRRDIARTMRAERIQILAPIPGKNTVGVEIANKNKVPIVLRDLFEAPEWINSKARIPIALGKDVYGQVLVADLADMPHMLVAGTTGSGKSVCINSILLSFLYRFRPDELRLILVDPKQVEMAIYNTIPHLVVPVVTDPKKVLLALRWVINEMEKRYKILAKVGVRNIHAFNNRKPKPAAPGEGTAFEGSSAVEVKQQRVSFTASANDDDDDDGGGEEEEIFIPERMPFIVVIIDELADLMLTAPADVESAIARITAKARAAGIHLIVATQSPRKDVVTGIIKANIPSRVAFQVANSLDSRIILDESGAENLVGKGDLLYLPPGTSKLTRGQGAFVSDEEVNTIVQWCSAQAPNCFEDDINNKLSAK
ncbi:MAG TPA: DNA translocase FtsK, partial [Candidatus Methylacidiphilales bacterium]|nr:DNA translocase FtsK [Candidatus Methylacidiphilales bacterium]